MRGQRFSHGYPYSNRRFGTKILELTVSRMWEAGSFEQRNIRIGSRAFAPANPIIRPCFATEIRESARPILGKKVYAL